MALLVLPPDADSVLQEERGGGGGEREGHHSHGHAHRKEDGGCRAGIEMSSGFVRCGRAELPMVPLHTKQGRHPVPLVGVFRGFSSDWVDKRHDEQQQQCVGGEGCVRGGVGIDWCG
jgi:hypothetical protein